MRCCSTAWRYVYSHMEREEDEEKDVRRKTVIFFIVLVSAVGYLMYYIPALMKDGLGADSHSLPFLISLTGVLVWLWKRRRIGDGFLRAFVCIACFLIAGQDMAYAAIFQRSWPVFVILIDLLLVIEAPGYMTKGIVVFVLVWLLLVEVEYMTRGIGFFDYDHVNDVAPYESRRRQTECEKPPCAHHSPELLISSLTPVYAVFLLDYFLTRGFAVNVLAEKSKMAAAVDAAEYVAGRLADFDLEAVASYLEEHAEFLPEELADSFLSLLGNLESYRPYLPDELFAATTKRSAATADMSPRAEAIPGVRDPRVALAFTDIRSSTALWEANADAMQKALDLQCNAIREALALHGGYEVKTIGDAFMISFRTSLEAVRFGDAAQTALGAEIEWPQGLTRPNMDDGFGVLTVRMGVHCGEVAAQRNTLTGRYDYFGPVVNRAARVEPFGAPGAVTVTADVVEAVGGYEALEERFSVVPYAEMKTGKGLKEGLELTALVPFAVLKIEASVRGVAGGSSADFPERRQSQKRVSIVSSTLARRDSMGSGSTMCRQMLRPVASTRNLFSGARAAAACVGVVKFQHCGNGDAEGAETARAGRRLQTLHAALEATRGQLSAVVNSVVWMSWGLHGACAQYVNESTRCMLLLQGALQEDNLTIDRAGKAPAFNAGLVTGPLAAVELAPSTRGRRFVTLFGACVSLGDTLCQRAVAMGTWVLVGTLGADSDSHTGLEHVRRVDTYDSVDVYDLDLAALADSAASVEEASGELSVMTSVMSLT